MANEGVASYGNAEQWARGLGWFSIGLGLTEVLAPQGVAKVAGIPGQEGLVRMLGMREIAHGVGIFSQRTPTKAVWSRVVGDAIDLACLGAAFTAPEAQKGRVAFATASVLGVTALDVLTARQLSRAGQAQVVHAQAVTINRPLDEVYRFCHDFENLPHFMSHLESVRVLDAKRSHWVATAPAGRKVEWDAEMTEDRPNEKIAWRSLPGADVENSGSVRFKSAPGGRGTEVHAEIAYNPPGGHLGAGIARLFGEEPGQQLKNDLYHFKQVMETGEIMHSDASIHEGMHPAVPPEGRVGYLTANHEAARLGRPGPRPAVV